MTDRLLARRITTADGDALRPALENPDLLAGFHIEAAPDAGPWIDAMAGGWDDGALFAFVLLDRSSAREPAVGFIEQRPERFKDHRDGLLWAEPSIALDPAYYGRGYAFEAMCALLAWSFDVIRYPTGAGIDGIRALCVPSNVASLRLLTKLGSVGMRDCGQQVVQVRDPAVIAGHDPQMTACVFAIMREDHETHLKSARTRPSARNSGSTAVVEDMTSEW
jgi:RimJ/RimL family protein N-acetyltransferase